MFKGLFKEAKQLLLFSFNRMQINAAIMSRYFCDGANSCKLLIGHYRNVRGLGKGMVVFRLFEKLRYSNERSTIF